MSWLINQHNQFTTTFTQQFTDVKVQLSEVYNISKTSSEQVKSNKDEITRILEHIRQDLQSHRLDVKSDVSNLRADIKASDERNASVHMEMKESIRDGSKSLKVLEDKHNALLIKVTAIVTGVSIAVAILGAVFSPAIQKLFS
ncbi:hypothetical protein [Shewanella sp. YIC-542]|uniref:hypothetical protein n=1 Tax=Shewanella mytili TaxID=3377111 RepID=UPI00398EAAB8